MKVMNKFDFRKYKRGIICIEIKTFQPERFINLLWKNEIFITNVVKVDITTARMFINLKDYGKIQDIAKKSGTKIKIVGRSGVSFLILNLRRRMTLVLGVILFIAITYYLSTFIWGIDINADHALSPYEIRQQLNNFGIKPGISKNKINVYVIEEKLIANNENIMWVKVRIEGSKLKISAAERQSPPNIIPDSEPCDLVASKDGEVERVYTKSGTSVVKKGDIIKKGTIVVKGEQGKEDSVYPVHAEGEVICRTFYEKSQEVKINGTKSEKTGNKVEDIYINILGKKLYLKKHVNKFTKYDKIESNKYFWGKETYYEVKDTPFHVDTKAAVNSVSNELYTKITQELDKSVKIIDKIVSFQPEGDVCKVRVLVIAEENVAVPQKSSNE